MHFDHDRVATPDRDPDQPTEATVQRSSPEVIVCARAAEHAVRRLAHLTISRPTMTPTEVDSVLAHLAETVAALPQVAVQLAEILDRSRDTHLLSMDGMSSTTDPDIGIDTARLHLDATRESAVALYRGLDAARHETTHISVAPRRDLGVEHAAPASTPSYRRAEERNTHHRPGPPQTRTMTPPPEPDPAAATRKPTTMHPIHVPEDWHDADLLTFEQFCALIQITPRTVRDWRRRAIGPCWTKLEGCGRLYTAVAEVRRFVHVATTDTSPPSRPQTHGRTA